MPRRQIPYEQRREYHRSYYIKNRKRILWAQNERYYSNPIAWQARTYAYHREHAYCINMQKRTGWSMQRCRVVIALYVLLGFVWMLPRHRHELSRYKDRS